MQNYSLAMYQGDRNGTKRSEKRSRKKQQGKWVENKKEWKRSVSLRNSILENKFAVLGGFMRSRNLSLLGGFTKGYKLSGGFSLV